MNTLFVNGQWDCFPSFHRSFFFFLILPALSSFLSSVKNTPTCLNAIRVFSGMEKKQKEMFVEYVQILFTPMFVF